MDTRFDRLTASARPELVEGSRPPRPLWWRVLPHAPLAVVLALLTITTGWIWNTRVAGGADSYGYVSQADLWLRGNLFIDQSFAASAPWPLAQWTCSPLGYRPDATGQRIVPTYSPGLPMLMAAAKAVVGPCGVFAIGPLAGGMLVLATYWIGRRLDRPLEGLGAAWIVATSPTMLFMLVQPMSDVPAAAAWAVALACLFGETAPLSLAAGVAAGVAILIRPNLAPVAAALALWILSRHPKLAAWFALPAVLGVVAVAIINTSLYGSPLSSGYDLTEAFSIGYVLPNLQRYGRWLMTVETPLAPCGLLCLVLPIRRLWPTPASRRGLPLLAATAAVVWIAYLMYVPWDAWWYLRFLLPAWPPMAIGTASLVALTRRAAVPLFAALGAVGVWQAAHRDVFTMAQAEAKYVEVAMAIESVTPPGAVIITAQHSGSLRYYAGRVTLRWDLIDPAWLDRIVDWLAARGHHPYLLIEDGEVGPLRGRFAKASRIGRLDWEPMITFRRGTVNVYDAVSRDRRAHPPVQTESRAIGQCLPQRPFPRLQ